MFCQSALDDECIVNPIHSFCTSCVMLVPHIVCLVETACTVKMTIYITRR